MFSLPSGCGRSLGAQQRGLDAIDYDGVEALSKYTDTGTRTSLGTPTGWGAIDPNADHHHGGSAVMADLDGDLDTDIVLGFPQGPPVLYRREGDRFVAEALPQPAASFLLNLADIDADGDLDLLAAGFRVLPVVLANDGAGHFSPLPMPDLPLAGLRVRELSPGDVDDDGDVDLYALTNSGSSNPAEYTDFMLEGDGRGGFVVAPEHVAGSIASSIRLSGTQGGVS
jgi:hypothetical protein